MNPHLLQHEPKVFPQLSRPYIVGPGDSLTSVFLASLTSSPLAVPHSCQPHSYLRTFALFLPTDHTSASPIIHVAHSISQASLGKEAQ